MFTKAVILIIMVFVQGQPATVTEHQFSTMESCIKARDQAMNGPADNPDPFMFSRQVKAFCVQK